MRGRVPILMYHSVDRSFDRRFRSWAVTPEELAGHLAHIRARGFVFLTVGQYVRGRAEGAVPDNAAVLTFDDGYADFHDEAMPVLEQYGATATLYLTTSLIGGRAGFIERLGEGDRRMLGWQQVREIADAGIEIGTHGRTHAALDRLGDREARAEIEGCRRDVEDRTGVGVTTFAYPYGFYSPRDTRLVRAAGYGSACAVRYRTATPVDDIYELPRLIVAHGAGLPLLLSGVRFPQPVRCVRSSAYRRLRGLGGPM